MNATTSPPPDRPTWLAAGLAASFAILVYRFAGQVTEIVFSAFRTTTLPLVQWLLGWEFHARLVIGLVLAILGATWQQRVLAGKSLGARYGALAAFAFLAILPIRFDLVVRPVPAERGPEVTPSAAEAVPVSLECKVIDGEEIAREPVFDERNVTDAKPAPAYVTAGYTVELHLDSEGSTRLADVTRAEIGKTLGFWIDGKLICVAEIHDPISSGVIHVPGDFSREEAARIACGLLARRR